MKKKKKKTTTIILYNIITNVSRSTGQQERSNFFWREYDENNYVVGRNYALDGDNGMKNNVHSAFSKGGREVRISLKYKLFNEKAFC